MSQVEPDDDHHGRTRDGIPSPLGLLRLLNYLWEEAELTRWHRGFRGKRTWAVVRSHLLSVARATRIGSTPLSDTLFLPETYYPICREQIEERLQTRLSAIFRPSESVWPLMLAIAEVKTWPCAHRSSSIVFKHLPQIAFVVDQEIRERAMVQFGEQLELWNASPSTRLIAAFTFGQHGSMYRVRTLALMPTSHEWLPARNRGELDSIEMGILAGRAFTTS